jgi:hypothetical protein
MPAPSVKALLLVAVALAAHLLAAAPVLAASPASITVDPGAYQGRYYIPGVTACCSSGRTTVALADGTYALDTGASVAGSYGSSSFAFTVAAGGVSVAGPSATAAGSVLRLSNTSMTIKPGSYTGRYFLSSFGSGREFTGAQTVVLVPGLAYSLDAGAHVHATIAGVTTPSDFLFAVGGTGSVSIVPGSPSVPASAAGAEIDLNSVPLHVYASPATTSYRLCSQPSGGVYTGNVTATAIPGLADCVSDGVNAGYFVAGPNGVQPASLTVGTLTVLFTTPASTTPATLASTTASLVQASPAFAALPAAVQAQVSLALGVLTQSLGQLTSLSPAQKAAYNAVVDVLVLAAFLSPDQGAALKAFAAAL